MRALLAVVVVALLVVGVIGFANGWFDFERTETPNRTDLTVSVDKSKWKADRDEFARKMRTRMENIDERLVELRKHARKETEEGRENIKATIDNLEKRRARLGEQLDELSDASRARWEELRDQTRAAWSDLQDGVSDAISRFTS